MEETGKEWIGTEEIWRGRERGREINAGSGGLTRDRNFLRHFVFGEKDGGECRMMGQWWEGKKEPWRGEGKICRRMMNEDCVLSFSAVKTSCQARRSALILLRGQKKSWPGNKLPPNFGGGLMGGVWGFASCFIPRKEKRQFGSFYKILYSSTDLNVATSSRSNVQCW